jgi:hypothetical protein
MDGVLKQTGTSSQDPKKYVLSESRLPLPENLIITARIRVDAAADRAGISLGNGTNGEGINLLLLSGNRVGYLDDMRSWGPSSDFTWTTGTWYWMKLKREGDVYTGKVWADGTSEPSNWLPSWTRSEGLAASPASMVAPARNDVLRRCDPDKCGRCGSAETKLTINSATSSSDEGGDTLAAKAVDGSLGSRWSSNHSDNQWIYVDLGSARNVSRVSLNWETAAGRDYKIQIKNSEPWVDTGWTDLRTVTNNTATNSWLDYTGLSGNGRYVRMRGQTRATTYGFSLWELEVYGN